MLKKCENMSTYLKEKSSQDGCTSAFFIRVSMLDWKRERQHDRKPPKRFKMRPSQESGVYTFMNLLALPSIIEGGGSQRPSPFTVSMIFLLCT